MQKTAQPENGGNSVSFDSGLRTHDSVLGRFPDQSRSIKDG